MNTGFLIGVVPQKKGVCMTPYVREGPGRICWHLRPR